MIYIVDDSVGALVFQKETGVSGNIIVDNLFYPLALMPNTIKYRAEKILNEINGKIVCVNPSIALNLKGSINGIEKFEEDYSKNPGLVLSNKIFAEKYGGVDVQILANTVVDTNISFYVAENLLNSYFETKKVVYIMEPCIHYYRKYIEKKYPHIKFYFLFDYIVSELGELQSFKNRYYVTENRKGFYLGAEELLGGNYISTRRLNW